MSTHAKGRYAAPRKPRTRSTPFYLLAALAAGLLLLAGACTGDTAEQVDPEPVADESSAYFETFGNQGRGGQDKPEPTTQPATSEPEPEPVTEDPEPAPEPTTEPEPEPEPEESDSAIDNATVGELNALDSAISYLDYTGFSKSGLIGQLEYEGYTAAQIEFAMSQIAPDWKAEAVESAESYLEFTSFSRAGLIDQLLYEGFTQAQAEHAVDQVGL